MSILGIEGAVRYCMCERVAEYGDCGAAWDPLSETFMDKGACGPTSPFSADVGLKIEDPFGDRSMTVSRVRFEDSLA